MRSYYDFLHMAIEYNLNRAGVDIRDERVAAAEGRPRGVHEAFSAAEQAVAAIGPWADVERETDELFSELMRNGEAQAS